VALAGDQQPDLGEERAIPQLGDHDAGRRQDLAQATRLSAQSALADVAELRADGAYRIRRVVCSALAPHGTFSFTTQVAHPQLKLIAKVLVNRHGEPWLMKNRLITHAHGWAREAGFSDVKASIEAQHIFSVSVARS